VSFDYNAYQAKFPWVVNSVVTYRNPIPRIECADGFSFSAQVGSTIYCSPRTDAREAYDTVEVGSPSEAEPLLVPYADDTEDLTQTVYGYVPVDLVNAIVAAHGGLALSSPSPRDLLHRRLYSLPATTAPCATAAGVPTIISATSTSTKMSEARG
jgi:hypothetical protein